ncbi:hypothetical protein ACP4OV_007730 [Aristida adscensionis]
MEDSSLFMQWAVNTLQQQEHPAPAAAVDVDDRGEAMFPSLQALREASHVAEMVDELIADADPANSWSSGDGDITDGSSGSNNIAPPAAMDHDVWPPSPNSASAGRAPSRGSSGSGSNRNQPPVSWNFGAATAAHAGRDGVPEVAAARRPTDMVYGGSPPRRRAGLKSSGSMSAPYAQDHIIAERKRREKINQRFIELSTVIPGLKKMDKATILTDATKHVKELQEKLKDLEAGRSNGRSVDTVVLVKRPCLQHAAVPDDDGSSLSSAASSERTGRKSLPETEARFSEKSVMVRVHCKNGKGVAVKVLAEVEELHLSIIHANVMPFSACTLIITITAKVEDGLTVTAEEIVSRLNSVFLHHHGSCNSSEETGN